MNKLAIVKNAQTVGGDVGVRYKDKNNGVMVVWYANVEKAVDKLEELKNDHPELLALSLIDWSGAIFYKVK